MEEKHSGIGMASFGLSVAVGCLMLVIFCVAGYLHAHRVHGSATYPGQTLVGFVIIFLMAADVLAVGLGIASLCQSGKKRVFGILGLVFSGLTLLGTVGLMIVGIMYASNHGR